MFRKYIYKIYRLWMLSTAKFRKMPDFIIVGVQKGGTTSLYSYLKLHPQTKFFNNKEIHFFDKYFSKGWLWYRSWFPLKIDNRISGEATPDYFYYPNVFKRMSMQLPRIKLIVLLRNPVDRAYSHFQMEKRKSRESLSFEDAIIEEQKNIRKIYKKELNEENKFANKFLLNKSYINKGLYKEQLERLFEFYDKTNLLVIQSEEFKNNTDKVFNQVCDFLSINRMSIPKKIKNKNVRKYPPINKKTKDFLNNLYKKHNIDLYKLIGEQYDW